MSPKKKISEKYPLSVDVGAHSVKMLQLTSTPRGWIIYKFARKEIPFFLAKHERESFINDALKKMFTEHKFRKVKASLVLPGSEVCVRTFTIPEMTEQEIPEAVKWASKRYIAYPLEEMVLSYSVIGQIVEQGSKAIKIVFAGVHRDIFDKYTGYLRGLGLKAASVTISCFALRNIALANDIMQNRSVALVNIGYSGIDISVFENNNLVFTRNIAEGGAGFDEAIVEQVSLSGSKLKVKPDKAQAFKHSFGFVLGSTDEMYENIAAADISAALNNHLDRVVRELQLSFSHYKQLSHGGEVEEIILAGGGSRLINIDRVLSARMSMSVNLLQSPISLEPEEELEFSAFSVAIGACLEEGQNPDLIKDIEVASRRGVSGRSDILKNFIIFFFALMVFILEILGVVSFYSRTQSPLLRKK